MYTLVLLSGGVGKRMNNSIPKQYMLVAGKPVIMHILERIDKIQQISEVVVVCAEEYISFIQLMLDQYGIKKKVKYAPAGDTRQASVYSGLSMVETDDVIIHEAARPFVKVEDFVALIENENDNVTYGTDIPFTVVKGHEFIEGELARSELVNVQLPQKFKTELLRNAHKKAQSDGKVFTEDASMIFYYFPNDKISICSGFDYNIKLTTRMDVLMGELIYDEEFRRRK